MLNFFGVFLKNLDDESESESFDEQDNIFLYKI